MQSLQQKKQLEKSEKNATLASKDLFLDSCIWIGYFLGDTPKSKDIVESIDKQVYSSILTIFEFSKTMKEKNIPNAIIANMLEIIEENSIIISPDKETVLTAAQNCLKYSLHSIDSILYSSSQIIDATFVTSDKHFSKTPNTIII